MVRVDQALASPAVLLSDDVAAMAQHGPCPAGDAASILGIPRRKVILYMDQRLIHVWNLTEVGRGRHRLLGLSGLFQMYVAAELELLGITPKFTRPVLELLKNEAINNPTMLDRPIAICADEGGVLRLANRQEARSAAITLNLRAMSEEFSTLVRRYRKLDE